MQKGRLVLVATPIGNLGDLSPRAREALEVADAWIVEDTRVSGKIQSHFGLKRPMHVLNDHATPATVAKLAELVESNSTVALVTDGGSPCISDPGAMLVDLCYEKELEVDAIPGPSAVMDALVLSGFFAQRFAFLGFLPRKPGPMKSVLAPFADSTLTVVVFESPFRIQTLLESAFETLGPRRFVIARELTKLHQQIFRGRLPDIPSEKSVPRKGEFTVVIEGLRKESPSQDAEDDVW